MRTSSASSILRALLALAGTAQALSATPAWPADKIVEADIPGSFMSLPVYVAYDKGIYTRHGLDVTLANIASGPDTVAAVLSGSIDFMLNSGDNIMRAMDKGSPALKAVVGNLGKMPFTVVARKDLPLPHKDQGYPAVIADLKGTTIGVVARGGSVDFIMRAMLRDGGLDPDKDVNWVAVGTPPTAMGAMQNKQIDVYLAFEPFQTLALGKRDMGQVVVDLRKGEGPAIFKDFPYNFYSGRADRIAKDPDMVRRYVDAMVESHAFIQDPKNIDEVVSVAAKYIKMDTPSLKALVEANRGTLSPYIPADNMQRWITFAKEAQGIQKNFKYEDLVATDVMPNP
jgi:NitT/TauT family transport system substrate-binding protein